MLTGQNVHLDSALDFLEKVTPKVEKTQTDANWKNYPFCIFAFHLYGGGERTHPNMHVLKKYEQCLPEELEFTF